MRALACFGGDTIHIIGKVPPANELKRLSGGHSELVTVIQHKTPVEFLSYTRKTNTHIVCAELTDESENIHTAEFPLNKEIVFVVGNEMEGIPTEIVFNADQLVYIPMPGKGFCLNTSQTANVLLYEYSRRVLTGMSNAATLAE